MDLIKSTRSSLKDEWSQFESQHKTLITKPYCMLLQLIQLPDLHFLGGKLGTTEGTQLVVVEISCQALATSMQ